MLRPAIPEDAAAVAAVHVASWRETYPGLLPDVALDGLDLGERTRLWSAVIARMQSGADDALFVAGTGQLVTGFVSMCRQRDPALRSSGFAGEVAALYVLRSAQRAGIGSALLARAMGHARERGLHGVALWVLEAKQAAKAFYEARGGAPVAERDDREGGATIREIAYGWSAGAAGPRG